MHRINTNKNIGLGGVLCLRPMPPLSTSGVDNNIYFQILGGLEF